MLLACLFLLALAWFADHLPFLKNIVFLKETVGSSLFSRPWLYPLLIAVCNLLLLPGGVLCIGSGLFFGLWWGFFLALAGNLGGAAIAFLISRAIGRQTVQRRFLGSPRWQSLDEAIASKGWKIVFFSQVHPLFPTSLLNYLYGITNIRFGRCMLWIALGQMPGLFLYAYLGTLTQLGIRFVNGTTHPRPIEFINWGGGLLFSLLVTAYLGRIAFKVMKEAREGTSKALARSSPF